MQARLRCASGTSASSPCGTVSAKHQQLPLSAAQALLPAQNGHRAGSGGGFAMRDSETAQYPARALEAALPEGGFEFVHTHHAGLAKKQPEPKTTVKQMQRHKRAKST